jgi:ribosomal protein L37AE/L43A
VPQSLRAAAGQPPLILFALGASVMGERVIGGEMVEERIVTCPLCRRSNRLYKRSATGMYRCGACRAALTNPFATRPMCMPAMRTIGIIAASVLAFLVIIVVIAGISSMRPTPAQQEELRKAADRDARIDKIISEIGPSALPPIPKPSYYTSTTATTAVAIPTVSITPLSRLPRYQPTIQPAAPLAEVPATVVPTNNEILFDAFPESTTKGEFTVINGASRHAVAKIIDPQTDTKILSFAICAGKQSKITGIPDGSYRVIFAFGDRLYAGTDRFEKPRGFSKFDRPFTFTTTTTSTDTEDATYYRTRYSSLEVTLTPVVGGNITTSGISQKEFERY